MFDKSFGNFQRKLSCINHLKKNVQSAPNHYCRKISITKTCPCIIQRFFFSCINSKFHPKIFHIFNIFAQNIDCGYMLEECRTKHPTDKTPHIHFVIGGQKPPHVFLKADKTPHTQKYNVDKTPHADFKIRTKPPSCFCSVDKQMEAD